MQWMFALCCGMLNQGEIEMVRGLGRLFCAVVVGRGVGLPVLEQVFT